MVRFSERGGAGGPSGIKSRQLLDHRPPPRSVYIVSKKMNSTLGQQEEEVGGEFSVADVLGSSAVDLLSEVCRALLKGRSTPRYGDEGNPPRRGKMYSCFGRSRFDVPRVDWFVGMGLALRKIQNRSTL